MSVFRGSITEYPGVIIDHFIPFNCERGRAFFLSHCHKDHMTGLDSPAIHHALQRRKNNLFCSEVTQSLLLKDPKFSSLAPYLKTLPMEYPVAMAVEGLGDLPPLSFTVTLLPAGHCPGSAMFFFQGGNGNVLYTGDFRLTLEETRRLQPLHSNGSLMPISTLYLDTTFCHPSAAKLPSRTVSRDHVLKITGKWLSGDPANVVRLHCASFGYEHIFMGVAERLKTKVHIARWKINAYADLAAVSDCLTSDGNSTRVHNCNAKRISGRSGGGLPCGSVPVEGGKPRVLHIKPSTIWFLSTAHSLAEPSVFLPQYHAYRVLHSMHASYTEICQFVSYLQPQRVVPCVVPVGDSTLTDVHSRLKKLLSHSHIVSDVVMNGPDGTIATLNREDDTAELEAVHDPSALTHHNEGSDYDYEDDTTTSRHWEQKQTMSSSFFSSVPSTSGKVDLPIMMTSHVSEHGGGVIAASPEQQDGSSGSVTVGSLEQTPLDLSLESEEISCDHDKNDDTQKESSSAKLTEDANVTSSVGFAGGAKVTNDATSGTNLFPSAKESDDKPPSEVVTEIGERPRQHGALPVKNLKTAHVGTKDSAKLALEANATKKNSRKNLCKEAVASGSTEKSEEVTTKPPCKKSRVAEGEKEVSTVSSRSVMRRQLFWNRDSPANIPISYIDLTLEEDSPEYTPNNDHRFIPNNDHHTTPTLINDRRCTSGDIAPIVISSCDSEQQEEAVLKEGSPDILPPTPGREQVESILQRKHLSVL